MLVRADELKPGDRVRLVDLHAEDSYKRSQRAEEVLGLHLVVEQVGPSSYEGFIYGRFRQEGNGRKRVFYAAQFERAEEEKMPAPPLHFSITFR